MINQLAVKILVIEDDADVRRGLEQALRECAYLVEAVDNGEEGLYRALNWDHDLIILDVMLPRRDGIEVCRSLRDQKLATPILMLTARDALDDRVLGLDSGADDYLVKPFEIRELRARLRALLRRDTGQKSGNLLIADLRLDPGTH